MDKQKICLPYNSISSCIPLGAAKAEEKVGDREREKGEIEKGDRSRVWRGEGPPPRGGCGSDFLAAIDPTDAPPLLLRERGGEREELSSLFFLFLPPPLATQRTGGMREVLLSPSASGGRGDGLSPSPEREEGLEKQKPCVSLPAAAPSPREGPIFHPPSPLVVFYPPKGHISAGGGRSPFFFWRKNLNGRVD